VTRRFYFNVWALLLLIVALYVLVASRHFEPRTAPQTWTRVIRNDKTGERRTQVSTDGGKTWR
jgi:hypothetical protein